MDKSESTTAGDSGDFYLRGRVLALNAKGNVLPAGRGENEPF